MAVVDASVYVALINASEQEHGRCWTWFSRIQRDQEPILAPAILLSEVAAALSRGLGDAVMAHRIVEQISSTGLVELVPISINLAEHAAAIAADHRIRGCDAVYVALADRLDQQLVTLDKQQLERAGDIVSAIAP